MPVEASLIQTPLLLIRDIGSVLAQPLKRHPIAEPSMCELSHAVSKIPHFIRGGSLVQTPRERRDVDPMLG